MVTRSEYLQGMLEQVMESYGTIMDLQDRPGDLATMRLELLRIVGTLKVITNKMKQSDYPDSDIAGLVSRSRHFLDNYYFEREIGIMEPLYADDPGRLRHIRLKIIEALQDKGLSEKVRQVLSDI